MHDVNTVLWFVPHILIGTILALLSLFVATHARQRRDEPAMVILSYLLFPVTYTTGLQSPAYLLVADPLTERRSGLGYDLLRAGYFLCMSIGWPLKITWCIVFGVICTLALMRPFFQWIHYRFIERRKGLWITHRRR